MASVPEEAVFRMPLLVFCRLPVLVALLSNFLPATQAIRDLSAASSDLLDELSPLALPRNGALARNQKMNLNINVDVARPQLPQLHHSTVRNHRLPPDWKEQAPRVPEIPVQMSTAPPIP